MQGKFDQINMNSEIDNVLNELDFPIEKSEVIRHAQTMGVHPQMLNMLTQTLPNTEFRSANEIKNILRQQSGQQSGQQASQQSGQQSGQQSNKR